MSDDIDQRGDPDQEFRDWKDSLAAGPTVRVEVLRVAHGEVAAVGVLDDLPTEEDIRERFGGGRYRLIVKRPDPRGRFVYVGCATVDLAGEPRLEQPQLDTMVGEPRLRKLVQSLLRELMRPLEKRVAELERKARHAESAPLGRPLRHR